jgi:hypothetical protein
MTHIRTPPRKICREVIDTVDPDFDRAFALYERSFPSSERSPRDYFVVSLEAKRAGRTQRDRSDRPAHGPAAGARAGGPTLTR